jgi:putative quorum-sensing-regulated virulence factor
MTLTATEKKLLVLALDQAAPAGEIASAGACLIKQLRRRFPDGYALLSELEGSRDSEDSKYGSVIMLFGKFKGLQLAQIPSDYLCWILDNCDQRLKLARKMRGRHFPPTTPKHMTMVTKYYLCALISIGMVLSTYAKQDDQNGKAAKQKADYSQFSYLGKHKHKKDKVLVVERQLR